MTTPMTTPTDPDTRIADLKANRAVVSMNVGGLRSVADEAIALAAELAEKLSSARRNADDAALYSSRYMALVNACRNAPTSVCFCGCHVSFVDDPDKDEAESRKLDTIRALADHFVAHAETKRELERLSAIDIRVGKLADWQLALDSKAARLMELERRLAWPDDDADTPWGAWYRALRDTVISALGTASLPTCEQIEDMIRSKERELEQERDRRLAARHDALEEAALIAESDPGNFENPENPSGLSDVEKSIADTSARLTGEAIAEAIRSAKELQSPQPPLPACKRCDKPVAHPAQEYCGAACSVERGRAVEQRIVTDEPAPGLTCECAAQEGCRLAPHHGDCGREPARHFMLEGWLDSLVLCEGCSANCRERAEGGKGEPPPFELPTLWCKVTGNPCGTDTWAVGYACDCSPCSEYVRRLAAQEMARPSGKGEPCEDCEGLGYGYALTDPPRKLKIDCPWCDGSGRKAREGSE